MAPQSQMLSIHYTFNFNHLNKYLRQRQERGGLEIYGHYTLYGPPEAN